MVRGRLDSALTTAIALRNDVCPARRRGGPVLAVRALRSEEAIPLLTQTYFR